MTKATIGTVSHGTLRNEDLLEAFAYELASIADIDDTKAAALVNEARQNSAILGMAAANERDEEIASDVVNSLVDALSEYAPAYCYFGANEGDGSDFGFWPSMDAIEELPRVSDPSEVDGIGEDCVYVNDHGNVTVYDATGAVIWDCV